MAFTATALAMLEALLFTHEAAHQTAATFLRTHADALARRALMLIDAIVQQETARVVEAGVICMDCGAEGLDVWYTGQTWGETLCEACYETRVTQGRPIRPTHDEEAGVLHVVAPWACGSSCP